MASLATEQDYIDLRDFLGDKKSNYNYSFPKKIFRFRIFFLKIISSDRAAENIAGIENEVVVKNDIFLATFFLAL